MYSGMEVVCVVEIWYCQMSKEKKEFLRGGGGGGGWL